MHGRFTGKVAMITGGASGIGRAAAMRFAAEGATVAILGRDAVKGAEVADLIAARGGAASFHQADVADSGAVQRAFAALLDRHGRLDHAFNNAGCSGSAREFDDVDLAEFDAVMRTNAYGTFHCMKLQVAHFLTTGGGTIVNCASIGGVVGAINQSSYIASKHAVVGLTRATALEYASRNIRINAICPGGVRTPMLKAYLGNVPADKLARFAPAALGRPAVPDEIAGIVLFLSSEDATTIIGQAYAIDGGLTAA